MQSPNLSGVCIQNNAEDEWENEPIPGFEVVSPKRKYSYKDKLILIRGNQEDLFTLED